MEITTVNSPDISRIGFQNGTLYVEFKSGRVHTYYAVPESIFTEFSDADSQDRYFRERIKPFYTYRRIG